ncbi:MAG: methyl-accepting chemotaxis protein [Methylococcaceae bacterium]
MPTKLYISHRLLIMAALSVCLFSISVAIGWTDLRSARDSSRAIYEDRLVPLNDFLQISNLMSNNYVQVLLAFQHNPNNPQHIRHEHSVNEHLDQIIASKGKIDVLWQKYMLTYLTEEEKVLSSDFLEKRKGWVTQLMTATQAIQSGNYDDDILDRFLKAGREEHLEAYLALEKLTNYQSQYGKEIYEKANENFETKTIIYGLLFIGGLIALTLIFMTTLRHISRSLSLAGEAVSAIAEGDFSYPVGDFAEDEIGALIAKVLVMRQSLSRLIVAIRGEIDTLSNASAELSVSARGSTQISDQQSDAASSMAAAVEQMSASIEQIEAHALGAGHVSQVSAAQSEEGSRVINNASSELSRIAIAVNTTALTIQELEGFSEQISSIVSVIKSIADQTNLLALNAAIEAARAGEQGRGFSVVADEVRTLAARTSASTQEITSMIGRIQHSTQRAVKEMNESVFRVNDGVLLANSAGSMVAEISGSGKQVMRAVADISSALKEQVMATQEIARKIEQIAQGAEQSHFSVSKTESAAQSLVHAVDLLKDLTQRFRIEH